MNTRPKHHWTIVNKASDRPSYTHHRIFVDDGAHETVGPWIDVTVIGSYPQFAFDLLKLLNEHLKPSCLSLFDWDKLWDQLPPWAHYVAMDNSNRWWYSNESPWREDYEWTGPLTRIPDEYAPPVAEHWKTSIRHRPTCQD